MSLFDSASLIVTPNGVKEDKLYSIKPSDGSGDLVVTRATTATRVNPSGLIEVVPRNLLTYSEQFDNAIWLKSNVTVTANNTIAPNGTMTADRLVFNTAGSFIQSLNTTSGAGTVSVYIKGTAGQTISIDNTYVFFPIVTLNGEWQRFSFNTSGNGYSIAISNNQGSTASTIYVWGAQLERGSTATEYFPTTDRLDVPRLDYTNSTCPSILVEPQRTNLYTYSQQLNQWSVLGSITITENDSVSPDGTTNADRAQFTASTDLLYRSGTGSAGSNTISVYAKAKSGTSQKFRFFGNGGLSYSSDQVATGEWQRFTFTYTYSVTTAGLAGATTGASDVLFYGFQHEIGSYATSYIPTQASSVTRNADVISKTGISSLIGQTEGTMFCEIQNWQTQLDKVILALSDGSFSNYLQISSNSVTGDLQSVIFTGGVPAALGTIVPVIGQNYKIAIGYKLNDYAIYINGTQVGTFNSKAAPSSLTRFDLGSIEFLASNYQPRTPYKVAALWKTRLTNTELATLTTI